jgi:hypothetical protein
MLMGSRDRNLLPIGMCLTVNPSRGDSSMTTEVEHLAAKLTDNLLRTTTFSSMELVVATAALYLKTHKLETEQDAAEFSALVSGAIRRYQSNGLDAMLDRRNDQLREEIRELRSHMLRVIFDTLWIGSTRPATESEITHLCRMFRELRDDERREVHTSKAFSEWAKVNKDAVLRLSGEGKL